MTLVSHSDFNLRQMNANTTFLNGDIEETIYMAQETNYGR